MNITWSLSIEEQFYLIFPCLFAINIRHPRRFLYITIVMLVAALIWRLHLVSVLGLEHLDGRIYAGSDTRFDSLLYGVLYATLLRWWPQLTPKRNARLSRRSFIIGLALLMFCLILRDSWFRETWRYTAIGIALILMAEEMLFKNGTVNHVLQNGLLIWIGKISYSLYLWHWLVITAANHWWPKWGEVKFASVALSSFGLAYLSWRFIEIRVQRLGQNWLQSRSPRQSQKPMLP